MGGAGFAGTISGDEGKKSESNDDQSDDAEGGIESIPTQVSNSSR